MNTLPPHNSIGKLFTIYALIDPRDFTVRYVGMTVNPYKRLQEHMNCQGSNVDKNAWMQELKNAGLVAEMKTLETVETEVLARNQEQAWIQHYRKLGLVLFNYQHGPDSTVGRHSNAQETYELISYRLQHRKWPAHLSAYMRWYYNENYIKKTGKHHSLVSRIKEQAKER